jgi:hypothetical protein
MRDPGDRVELEQREGRREAVPRAPGGPGGGVLALEVALQGAAADVQPVGPLGGRTVVALLHEVNRACRFADVVPDPLTGTPMLVPHPV